MSRSTVSLNNLHVLSVIHEEQDTISSISCCIHFIMTSSSPNASPNAPRKSKSWVYDLIEEDYDDENLKMCKLCGAFIRCGRNTKCSKKINLSYHLFKHHPNKAWEAKTRHLHEILHQEELNQARQN